MMAILTLAQHEKDGVPVITEAIEVRFWGTGGKSEQNFFIGDGVNFQANGSIWTEMIYTVHGAQVFYTRTFLHQMDSMDTASAEEYLDSIVEKGEGQYSLSGMLPQTELTLTLEKGSYEDFNGETVEYTQSKLEVLSDVGVVLGSGTPGDNKLGITLRVSNLNSAVEFMRALIHEIANAEQGKRPNPAMLPPGSSDWPFARMLNQKSYDTIATDYQEEYFENPLLADSFERWLDNLPQSARILDAGCGHGDPVIARLLEKGFHVAGADFSPAMLARARERFPQVDFYHKMTSELDFDAEFDAACSFSSTLYLDPIDLLHSIYRLHCAIKPGGLLFLFGYDLHPGWRGEPLDTVMEQIIWSWTYSADEAAAALSEHGYFEVLDVLDVTTEEEREERREQARQQQEEQEKELEEMRAAFEAAQTENAEAEDGEQETSSEAETESDTDAAHATDEERNTGEVPEIPVFDLSSLPPPPFYDPIANTAYQYVVIARRK